MSHLHLFSPRGARCNVVTDEVTCDDLFNLYGYQCSDVPDLCDATCGECDGTSRVGLDCEGRAAGKMFEAVSWVPFPDTLAAHVPVDADDECWARSFTYGSSAEGSCADAEMLAVIVAPGLSDILAKVP